MCSLLIKHYLFIYLVRKVAAILPNVLRLDSAVTWEGIGLWVNGQTRVELGLTLS